MRPLVLVCDPEHDYSRRFHEVLSREGMDVRHVRSANECLVEVQVYFPRTVLISSSLQSGEMALLLKGLSESTEALPEVVLTGTLPPQDLSQRWGVAVTACLQTPVDEDHLAERLIRTDLNSSSAVDRRDDR